MSFSDSSSFRTCPWCGVQDVSMSIIVKNRDALIAGGGSRQWTWLSCPRCGGVVSIETRANNPAELKSVPDRMGNEYAVKHLPENVSEYFQNAQKVLNAGVPSAAAVELRRTLEAAAINKSVTERPLVAAIKKLAEKGLITKDFVDVLSHVRKIGNVGAHATDQKLSAEEVRQVLSFTTQLLRNLFEVPEELRLIKEVKPESEPETA